MKTRMSWPINLFWLALLIISSLGLLSACTSTESTVTGTRGPAVAPAASATGPAQASAPRVAKAAPTPIPETQTAVPARTDTPIASPSPSSSPTSPAARGGTPSVPEAQGLASKFGRAEIAETSSNTLISAFLSPIDRAAEKRRSRHESKDPQKYNHQVNPRLARLGTTWLLKVCGLDHEPPAVEKVMVCSNSLFLVRPSSRIDTITFTHDTRFPEQEIEERILGQANSARRSDTLWLRRENDQSGIRVLREAYQNATALPIDFIVVIQSDTMIQAFVDKVFGKLKVNVPVGFTAHPIYLDENTKLPAREYKAGVQEMDGAAVLQYMKSVPMADTYPPELENNERKHVVFGSIFKTIEAQKLNPFFWPSFLSNLNDFVQCQYKSGNIIADFNMGELIFGNLNSFGDGAKKLVFSGKPFSLGVPHFGKARYYVDPNLAVYSQSPIQWGTASNGDQFAKRDIEDLKVYKDYYVEVPKNGNALDPDLVNGYWKPVRQDVENFLLGDLVEESK